MQTFKSLNNGNLTLVSVLCMHGADSKHVAKIILNKINTISEVLNGLL